MTGWKPSWIFFSYLKSDLSIFSPDEPDWDYLSSLIQKEEDTEISAGVKGGNWGNKLHEGARWIRRGKLAAWSPARDDWEASSQIG